MEDIRVGEYISRKEYLKRYDNNVGYALHVQNSIKKDDYARLNIGEIVRVIGIKENKVNKKAIYYGIYDDNWFDSGAVENFSNNIIDLIEPGDIGIMDCYGFQVKKFLTKEDILELKVKNYELLEILTKEQFNREKYVVGE